MPPQPVPEMVQLACVARRVLRRMCYTLLPLLLTYGTSCRGSFARLTSSSRGVVPSRSHSLVLFQPTPLLVVR